MIYLVVSHTNDEDADYFAFSDIYHATRYIFVNSESEWIMSDMPFEEMPLDDYTFID